MFYSAWRKVGIRFSYGPGPCMKIFKSFFKKKKIMATFQGRMIRGSEYCLLRIGRINFINYL